MMNNYSEGHCIAISETIRQPGTLRERVNRTIPENVRHNYIRDLIIIQ